MGRDIICGLDMGTSKICLTCGLVDSGRNIDILASATVPAQGIRSGRIIDSQRLKLCIREARDKLHRQWGIKVRRVYVNIDSPDLRAKLCQQRLNLPACSEINKKQIAHWIDSCICSHLDLDRRLIHTGLRNFTLDNRLNCINPEGLRAKEIKLNIVVVSVLIPTINSLQRCIKEAGLILAGVAPSGYAQALGLFREFTAPAEKERILIDIGAGLIKITLFKHNLIKDILILPLGAQSITQDIAVRLKLSLDCAEQLKLTHGRALWEEKHLQQKILVKDGLIRKVIPPRRLYEIIALQSNYLLYKIKQALLNLDYANREVSEIVVTGGGSILEGFLERAEKILAKPVKTGNLFAIKDSRIQAQSAIYATSIGLIYFGYSNKHSYREDFYSFRTQSFWQRLIKQAVQLYREYF